MRLLAAAAWVGAAACSSRSLDPGPHAASPARLSGGALAARAAGTEPDPGWPRALVDDDGFAVHAALPQIERLDGDQLQARVAVSVAGPATLPAYAVVRLRARAGVDKLRRLVTLDDVDLDRPEYAAPPPDGAALDAAISRSLPSLVTTIALDRIVAELAAERAWVAEGAPRIANEPPRIVVAETLTVLVPIDGGPAWRRAGERWDRVVNTRALLVADRTRRWIYLYLGDAWYRARSLDGPWRTATLLPPGLERLRVQLTAQRLVDLLDARGSSLMQALAIGHVPRIVVTTVPTELVQLDGPAVLERIAETRLAYVANSRADLFADDGVVHYYLLLSGRWFRAPALDGPWQFVPAASLPRDFARIPPTHPKALVLAAVPGTALADEALVANELADSATLRAADATLEVRYDGPPRFERIEGTPLRYAVNSPTPVVELPPSVVDGGLYYALADGVWFRAAAAAGPWRLATSVPAALYDIPARSPLHFVTYARLFATDGERVRVGVTPGYLGACAAGDGTVVFGTGYGHAPWIGERWIGRAATYGFAARWEPGFGWTLGGVAGTARATFRPWWTPAQAAVAAPDAERFADERANVYGRWTSALVPRASLPRTVELPASGDDLYAGADGRVYRVVDGTWQRRAAEGWQPATRGALQASSSSSSVAADPLRALERERHARLRGEERWQLFRVTATAVP